MLSENVHYNAHQIIFNLVYMRKTLGHIKSSLQVRINFVDQFPDILVVLVMGFIGHFCFIFLFYLWGVPALFYLNFLSTFIWGWAIINALKGYKYLPLYLVYTEMIVHALFASAVLGREAGFDLYILPLALWLAYHPIVRAKFATIAGPGSMLVWVMGRFLWSEAPESPINANTLETMLTMNSLLAGLSISYIILNARQLVKQQSEQLIEQAARDKLTGLYNRHYLQEIVEHTLQSDREERKPFSVVLIDLDHFKAVNDEFGHDIGDTVLRDVSSCLQNSVRSNDIVCRWGGEEFVILMQLCSLEQAAAKAESIRLDINAAVTVNGGDREIPVTASIGVASAELDESFSSVLSRADRLLYRAKASGRNCVISE